MHRICKSVDVDMAHIIEGHGGPCLNIHGHTWKFEVEVAGQELDRLGMVADFGQLKKHVLIPVHELCDHAFALSERMAYTIRPHLESIWQAFRATRVSEVPMYTTVTDLNGARHLFLGDGMKVAVFPFAPTSERLAEWLYGVANRWAERYRQAAGQELVVVRATVYETLHPVKAFATYHGRTA